jgi:hypothetical protein
MRIVSLVLKILHLGLEDRVELRWRKAGLCSSHGAVLGTQVQYIEQKYLTLQGENILHIRATNIGR